MDTRPRAPASRMAETRPARCKGGPSAFGAPTPSALKPSRPYGAARRGLVRELGYRMLDRPRRILAASRSPARASSNGLVVPNRQRPETECDRVGGGGRRRARLIRQLTAAVR